MTWRGELVLFVLIVVAAVVLTVARRQDGSCARCSDELLDCREQLFRRDVPDADEVLKGLLSPDPKRHMAP